MTVVTSKPSPVTIGTGRNKETIYTATRTTKLADGTYDVDILQYSDAQGAGGKVIGSRDPGNPNKINFNSNASGKIKQNSNKISSASKNQMESMRGEFVTKSQEAEAYNSANGNRNTAPAPPDNSDNSQGNPDQTSTPASIAETKTSKPARKDFGSATYPLGLGNSKQDVVMFTMMEYQPRKLSSSRGQFGFSDRDSNRNSIGSVTLPVPSGIQDSNGCDWGSGNMNALEIAAGIAALQGIKGDFKGAANTAANAVGTATGAGAGDMKDAIAGLMAGAATGTGGQLLARTVGAVINPNMELLFKGPTLRDFSFTYKLSPRSKEEAESIIRIIRFFKQGMSPIKSDSNLFLKAPHTFKIQYKLRGEEDHPYIGKIKECALKTVGVQYTPEGSYATYHDGTMASYQMTLSFSELEPIFNNDYEDDNDQSLGF